MLMNVWSMGVTMNQPLHLCILHLAHYGLLIDIHDAAHGLLSMFLACTTHATGKPLALLQGQQAEQALSERIADNAPQSLIGHIVCTQHIAMT